MECLKLFNRLWRSKRSFVLLHLLSFFLCISMFLNCSLGIKAEEIDPTPTPTSAPFSGTFYISTDDFIQQMWDSMWPTISAPFIIADKSFATAQQYLDWLAHLGEPEPWVQYPNVTVHSTHPPTGNIPLDVQQSTEVEVPIPVQNSILQFIQYQVAQNPVSYTECYIQSYKMLGTSYFGSYSVYKTVLQYMENMSKEQGYLFFLRVENTSSYGYPIQIVSVPTSLNWNFYGTVNNGVFNNVNLGINWQGSPTLLNVYNYPDYSPNYTGVKFNYLRSDNGAQLSNRWLGNLSCQSFKNQTGLTIGGDWIVLSSSNDKELVYVFNTMNAYKNYNSGMPQPYYLTSEGLEGGTWTNTGSGSINTGTMNNSGNYYSSVTSGVGSNWTPEQILALVDKVSKGGSSSGSGSSDDDENKKSKMWERIGNAIGNLIDGVVDVITSVVEKLTDAILSIIHLLTGYTDEGGTYHEGLLGKLTSLISVDFNGFLSSVFSWMPPEIVTLFTATLLFAVFFAIWKMIRG